MAVEERFSSLIYQYFCECSLRSLENNRHLLLMIAIACQKFLSLKFCDKKIIGYKSWICSENESSGCLATIKKLKTPLPNNQLPILESATNSRSSPSTIENTETRGLLLEILSLMPTESWNIHAKTTDKSFPFVFCFLKDKSELSYYEKLLEIKPDFKPRTIMKDLKKGTMNASKTFLINYILFDKKLSDCDLSEVALSDWSDYLNT
ncbi:hypothetical protein BpHYR1_043382 [Brachionus plicatilis]|uniref:Uncharacterized protein n=1 Tax=Brachionus plicatilis TaxID=10195 RepID=A0A3M7QWR4_BRAPC|nr:hypothetical protein BpHYR1_043382 [Brachionus plicatilis]